jgi:hypothetical protein
MGKKIIGGESAIPSDWVPKQLEEKTMNDTADKTMKTFFVSSYEHDGFDTFEAAKKDASVRAGRDRDGDSYYVYELVGKVQTPPRVWNTTWEDVR